MGYHLIINPGSGKHSTGRINKATILLAAHGINPSIFMVSTPDDVRKCCESVYEADSAPFFIIAAGDGTVNVVLNYLTPGTATIAILPLGTSNVLAAELGISSIQDGVERIVRGNTLPLCTGRLITNGSNLRFALMAGIGIDGATVRDVKPKEKKTFKQGAYAISALRNCLKWDSSSVDLITPERTVTCHTAIACNASRYGGNFILAPGTDLFSPGFTVICITGTGRTTYLKVAFWLLLETLIKKPLLLRLIASEITIRGIKPIQIDGDFAGYGPARLVTETDVARIII
jgi:diacylglycerol kinase family enzyme